MCVWIKHISGNGYGGGGHGAFFRFRVGKSFFNLLMKLVLLLYLKIITVIYFSYLLIHFIKIIATQYYTFAFMLNPLTRINLGLFNCRTVFSLHF